MYTIGKGKVKKKGGGHETLPVTCYYKIELFYIKLKNNN